MSRNNGGEGVGVIVDEAGEEGLVESNRRGTCLKIPVAGQSELEYLKAAAIEDGYESVGRWMRDKAREAAGRTIFEQGWVDRFGDAPRQHWDLVRALNEIAKAAGLPRVIEECRHGLTVDLYRRVSEDQEPGHRFGVKKFKEVVEARKCRDCGALLPPDEAEE